MSNTTRTLAAELKQEIERTHGTYVNQEMINQTIIEFLQDKGYKIQKEEQPITEENNEYDIFEDRVISLLKRWRQFVKKNPKVKQYQVVRSCMAEINDGYTRKLMGEDDED